MEENDLNPNGKIRMIENIETYKLNYILNYIKSRLKFIKEERKKYFISLKSLIETELYRRNYPEIINKISYNNHIQKNSEEEIKKYLPGINIAEEFIEHFMGLGSLRVVYEEGAYEKYPGPCPGCHKEDLIIVREDRTISSRRNPYIIVRCKNCKYSSKE